MISREGSEYFMPGVAHGDAVVDADGVEDERHAAGLADRLLDELADLVEVDMAGDDVDVGIGDGDKRFFPIGLLDAGRPEEAAVGRALIAAFDGIGSHGTGPREYVLSLQYAGIEEDVEGGRRVLNPWSVSKLQLAGQQAWRWLGDGMDIRLLGKVSELGGIQFWRKMMSLSVTLEMPEDVLSLLRTTPEGFGKELRLAAAVKWFELGAISQEKAAEIAGLDRAKFIESCSRMKVSPLQTTPEELEMEWKRVVNGS